MNRVIEEIGRPEPSCRIDVPPGEPGVRRTGDGHGPVQENGRQDEFDPCEA